MTALPHIFPRFIVIVIAGLACTLPGSGGRQTPTPVSGPGPTVTLADSALAETLISGRAVKIQSTSLDPTAGIARVELVVGGRVIWSDANPDPRPQTPYIVAQPWTPPAPGSYALQVRAYNTANMAGQSARLIVEVSRAVPTAATETAAAEPAGDSLLPANPPPDDQAAEPARPSATPSPRSSAPASTPSPWPAPALPPPASPTPRPEIFAPTGLEPAGRFKDIWTEIGGGDSRLGYPTGPEINDRDFARQHFAKGLMYWWDNPEETDFIWVLETTAGGSQSGGHWQRYGDRWAGGDVYGCEAARRNGASGPLRGFGQVWCDQAELQERLGNPRDIERGSGGTAPYGRVQFYQGGLMLDNPLDNEVYVLFAQGDWLRVSY